MKLTLTDSEWVRLVDANSDDAELPACRGNVDMVREYLIEWLIAGRNEDISDDDWKVAGLKQALSNLTEPHELSTVLAKVCNQLKNGG